jgi:hypothetical protein
MKTSPWGLNRKTTLRILNFKILGMQDIKVKREEKHNYQKFQKLRLWVHIQLKMFKNAPKCQKWGIFANLAFVFELNAENFAFNSILGHKKEHYAYSEFWI